MRAFDGVEDINGSLRIDGSRPSVFCYEIVLLFL